MNLANKLFFVLSVAAGVMRSFGQTATPFPAPVALPACLIHFTEGQLGYTYSRVALYNQDLTWTDISFTTSGPLGNGSEPGQHGTFTYTVDPQNSSHATIAYDDGSSDQLYFYAPNSGTQSSSLITAGTTTAFTLYPRQINNGGGNVSNRSVLTSGGTTTNGIVIQAGGPRWVLFRGVGASLANFGVPNAVSSPSFTLYDSTGTVVATSSVWSADPNLVPGYETVFSMVGAFSLEPGSDEGVLLIALNPGAYTAIFQAGSSGTILAEAYLLPF